VSARREILPIFIPHLGCPHTCVFCSQNAITDRDAQSALRALNDLLESGRQRKAGSTGEIDGSRQGRELAFYGGSFTAIPVAQQLVYLEKAKQALDAGLVSSVRLSTRPDAVDMETLDRLRHYGVTTVEFGAQSMCDEVLRLSGRGHTSEDVRRAARMTREAGLSLGLQMMTGLPGDSEEGALETARELILLCPDFVRIYPTVIVRGTALERLWREGLYREHTVEDAVRVCSRLLPLFDEAGIPVIRLGLNPTDRLSGGDALAGAYHPALGELVYSRILRNRMEDMLSSLDCAGRDVEILVPPTRLSQAIGQKKANLLWLADRFCLSSLRILPDSSAAAEIRIHILKTQP